MNKKYINRSKHQVEKIKAKAAVSLKLYIKSSTISLMKNT